MCVISGEWISNTVYPFIVQQYETIDQKGQNYLLLICWFIQKNANSFTLFYRNCLAENVNIKTA